jgi:hypothetical protein
VVSQKDLKSPLAWWKMHESQFPNVGLLAKQIFGILRNQIKIERIFSSVDVLTSLQHCQLGLENLDALVMIYKNWHDNA